MRMTDEEFKKKQAAEIDTIKDRVSIVDMAQVLGYTVRPVGSYYTLAEHDSVRIKGDGKSYKRYSADEYGDVIDFTCNMQQISKKEAIEQLKGMCGISREIGISPVVRRPQPPPPKKTEFKLPERSKSKYSHVFAYLCGTRKIATDVVSEFVKRKYLYEEGGRHHNAVFVGYDYDGKAKYGFLKTTSSKDKFAIDIPGSKKYPVAFFVNNNARSLVVSEAIIDAMSVMTITQINGSDYHNHSYLAMQGNNTAAVEYHLNHNPQISQVVMAVDNDKTGDRYREEISDIIKKLDRSIKLIDRRPKNKDFNEDLQKNEYYCKSRQTQITDEREID